MRGSVDGADEKFNPIYCRTNYIVHIYVLNDEWRGCTITEVSEIENNAQTDFNNKITEKKNERENKHCGFVVYFFRRCMKVEKETSCGYKTSLSRGKELKFLVFMFIRGGMPLIQTSDGLSSTVSAIDRWGISIENG